MTSQVSDADRDGDALKNRRPRCIAGVLIGGQSRRMGRPKALLELPNGATMVEHVVAAASKLGSTLEETVLLGELDGLPAALGHLPLLADSVPGAGPAAGLCTLLERANDRWALLLSCDMPLLDDAILGRLLDSCGDDVDAVSFVKSQQPPTLHACCALYHPRVLPEATAELMHRRGSLQEILSRVRTIALTPTKREREQLTNVNTPDDHQRIVQSP